jgi:hypothetical protein
MDRADMNKRLGMSEKQLDTLAEEYENDTWDSSHLGKVIVGRPSISNEEVRPVTFKLPVSRISAMDTISRQRGETRSEFLRDAVEKALLADG